MIGPIKSLFVLHSAYWHRDELLVYANKFVLRIQDIFDHKSGDFGINIDPVVLV